MKWWQKPINRNYVNFTLRIATTHNFPNFSKIDSAIHDTDDEVYILNDIYIVTFTDKTQKVGIYYEDRGAILLQFNKLAQIYKSYYPFRFFMPKTSIKYYETENSEIPQKIIINEYGYINSYTKALYRIYEDWAIHFESLSKLYLIDPKIPMVKGSSYLPLIKEHLKNLEKEKNKINKNKKVNKKLEEKKEINNLNVFYTDGSGAPAPHYSILLVNTDEKWWHPDKKETTNNQAEIKAVIAAIYIALERKYDNIEIRTDSQNIIKWLHGRDFNFKTNIEKVKTTSWATNDEEISRLIDGLVSFGNKVPNLTINWIPRKKNRAHAV